jgi:hypothetical protein
VRILDDGLRLNRHLGDEDRVVVAVTHTDMDPRVNELGGPSYRTRITQQLAPMTDSIRNPSRIRLVAGSLATEAGAADLSDRIVQGLL